MPRLPRIQVNGAVDLVTCRGGLPEPLFQDRQDYKTYLDLLGEYKTRHHFKLFAYCLLPDHVHLCIEPSSTATISEIMHDVTTRYTKHFNKRYGRSGHLFQERFKTVLVEKQHALLPLTAYLHTHPTRTGLAKPPQAYPFSSYTSYLASNGSHETLDLEAEICEVLTMLPAEHTEAAYEQYVASFPETEVEQLRTALQQRVLGSEEFVRTVRAALHRAKVTAQPATAQATVEATTPHRSVSIVSGGLVAALILVGCFLSALSHRVGFLEQATLALSKENDAMFRARQSVALPTVQHSTLDELSSLTGSEWEIRLMPMAGKGTVQQDQLDFTDTQVSSAALGAQGFPGSNYTVTVQADGTAVWETMQTDADGTVVCWRGEWSGKQMRGIMTRQSAGTASETFTFAGAARKLADTTRSEI